MMLLMRLLTLVVGELVMLSLMFVVICLGSVVAGTLLFLTFIDFSLLFLELWSIMMGGTVLLLILWCGLLVPISRGVVWFMRFGTGPSCPGHLVFEIRNGFMFLHLLSVLRTLLIGPVPLVFGLNGSPFYEVFIGLLVVWILGLVAFLMSSCSFFMSFGQETHSLWRRLILVIFDQGVQFQCRLFLLVQALIFGIPVVSLVLQ